jgi:molecular chaperone HtpG
MAEETKSYQFKAEIKQLLNILIHSLYKEREIFLRELISNASDALTQIHFEMLTNSDVLDLEADLAIHIDISEDGKTLIIQDSGIGMTRDELARNLGTIAQSGADEFLQAISDSEQAPSEIIGQFGVGFYSVFMVAKEVKVISRSYQPEAQSATWLSTGGEDFSIEPAEKSDRGTEIHIKLKEEAKEFSETWRLKQIVTKYSDYIGYPIYLGEDQANQQESIWRRSSSEISQEEYKKYYQQLTMDFEDPLITIHLSSDAPIHIRSLMHIPAKSERGILNLRQEHGLSLYSHNVLIQEFNRDLLPKWLEFVVGVVDSEDLPLNVSRETVQSTRAMARLGRTLRRRLLREIKELAESDAEKYSIFWDQYGPILKEGLALEPDSKEELLPLFRYRSLKSSDKLISLDEYVKAFAEDQAEIYYIVGGDLESIQLSPHLDLFRDRDLDVLLFIDPIDPFLPQAILHYQDFPLRNIDDASLELPEDVPSEEHDETEGIDDKIFNQLIGRFVTALGDKVLEVRESKVLKNSPVRLVTPEDSPSRDIQRVQRYLTDNYEIPKKILEVNRGHNLISDLARILNERREDEIINLIIEQLFESSLVMEGLHPNPAKMLPKIERLLELSAGRSLEKSDD